jgi:hypothetical protein
VLAEACGKRDLFGGGGARGSKVGRAEGVDQLLRQAFDGGGVFGLARLRDLDQGRPAEG